MASFFTLLAKHTITAQMFKATCCTQVHLKVLAPVTTRLSCSEKTIRVMGCMVNQFSINMLPRKHALLPEAPSQSGYPKILSH